MPRDRREVLVFARRQSGCASTRVGVAGVDDPPARRAGAVDLHRRRREEPVAGVAPGHGPYWHARAYYWIRRTGSPRMYADHVVVSETLVPAGYDEPQLVQHPARSVALHV